MPANFNPEMSVIKDLKPFKFWCSKVLPSVYDDSLSYYELLTKVLRYLNDTMESVETLNGNVENIYNAYLLLEDYVNNYFDNADFQQMVNDKLDEMAEDGTLTEMIGNYVDPLFDQMSEDLDTAIENQNTLITGRFNTQDTRLGVMESQMNEFIADHAGPAMAFTLWSGYADAVGTNITLSDDPANYDYIEVYLRTVGSSYCPSIHRFPADTFHSTPNLSVVQTEIGTSTNDTRLHEYRINIESTDSVDATKYRIRYSNHWLWTGTVDSDAINYENNITDEQQASAGIVKIVGIKNVQNNAEVIDARIGANNTTYTTLGDAIRSQVTNLQYAINDRAHIALTSTSDKIDFQQGGNGAVSQVSAPTMSKFNSEISDLRGTIQQGGFNEDFKVALENLVSHIGIWSDGDGAEYVQNLHDAMYPPTGLERIEAVYTQSGTVYNIDSLDSLKNDLVVTAYYSDLTSRVITGYSLNGSLEVGTSTITVSYQGKTDTFDVTVTDFMLNDILTLDGILNTRNGHDTSATTWEDWSGNQNDFAKLSGASNVLWGSDYAGFDATNRVLALNKDLFGSASKFTVEIVVQSTGNASELVSGDYYGAIIMNRGWQNQNSGLRINQYNTGVSSMYINTNLGFSSTGGLIKHIAWVFDGTNVTRYINGVAQTPVARSFPYGTALSTWRIGGSADNQTAFFPHMHMHRIGMSAKAMTAEEITARFNFFKNRFNITEA